MKKYVLAVSVLLASSAGFSLPLVNIDLSVGAISHDPSGYLQYPADTGTRIDLKDTLGLDKETKVFARAKIELPIIPNLYLQYMPMEFSGRKQLTQTITYGGQTFTASTTVDTKVKLDRYDVGLYYNLPFIGSLSGGILDAELGVNVRVVDFEGSIRDTSGTISESKSATIPIPMLYTSLGLNLPYVSVLGELRGITYSGNRYYDITGEVRIKPFSIGRAAKLFVGIGYRYEQLKLDSVSDINADIKIKGPFAVAGVSF